MSTQTGITSNRDLARFFGQCRDGRFRLFKVSILDEQLSLDGFWQPKSAKWEQDWHLVLEAIEDAQPCYVLFRSDERDEAGMTFRWILISWSPDSANVRQKMLYASTKATLRKEFGGGQIKDDYYANQRDDLTLEGYKRHLKSASAPGPLSRYRVSIQ